MSVLVFWVKSSKKVDSRVKSKNKEFKIVKLKSQILLFTAEDCQVTSKH